MHMVYLYSTYLLINSEDAGFELGPRNTMILGTFLSPCSQILRQHSRQVTKISYQTHYNLIQCNRGDVEKRPIRLQQEVNPLRTRNSK